MPESRQLRHKMDRTFKSGEPAVSEPKWYYLDADRKQTGPVTADDIRAALRAGNIGETTLVWRDGLSDWRPVSQLAGELGISTSVPPPPLSSGSGANADAASAYQPPHSQLEFRRVAADDVVPAGFVRRWAALFLDGFVVGVPAVILAILVAIPMGLFSSRGETAGPMVQGFYYLFHFLIAPFYYAGMESSVHQATLGKRALGIKVTDDNGHRLSFGHALGRWFAAALSYMTLYVGFLMAAFTERKRAL
ncbi:MAG TPA: RDD family protein, partial [Luteimonas sp.]|nr:RDD family protein [Luteimonas sp.]